MQTRRSIVRGFLVPLSLWVAAATAIAGGVAGCARGPSAAASAPSLTGVRTPDVVDDDARAIFAAHGVDGAFVVLDEASGVVTVVGPERAGVRYTPASTFKIPNSLVALETGVVPDEHFVLRWDGTKRAIAAWNHDHDLASAFRYSVVWYYQEIARRVGPERMQRAVDAIGYGNRDISSAIDRFWLDGTLRISPREQVEFVRRLYVNELPFRRENMDVVRRLMIRAQNDHVVWSGKTGLGDQDGQALGWLVGAVERGGHRWDYATIVIAAAPNGVEAEMTRLMPIRWQVTRELFARQGVSLDGLEPG